VAATLVATVTTPKSTLPRRKMGKKEEERTTIEG
jgi:hypothetical protein